MRRARKLTTAALVTLGVLVFMSAPALAGQAYEKVTSTFGSEGSGPGKFKEPTGIAVNDETEEVYVLDSGNDRIEAFNEEHKFQFEFDGGGTHSNEGKAAPTGKFLEPSGIAVDNACADQKPALTEVTTPTCKEFDPSFGDVYVADTGHNVVDKYSATGEYEGQLTGTSGTGTGTLAEHSTRIEGVTTEAGVFVVGQEITGEGGIPSGTTITGLPEPGVLEISQEATESKSVSLAAHAAFVGVKNVAVDAAGDVWVYESNGPKGCASCGPERQVDELSDTGSSIEAFLTSVGAQAEFPGLAVNASGGVYTTGGELNAENELYEFSHAAGRNEIEKSKSVSFTASLAIIASTNDLLVDEGSSIELFKSPLSGGALPLFTFPVTGLSESAGIAVNGAKGEGTIYATQRANDDVDVFESGEPEAPKVIGESASTVGELPVEAEFAATINSENREATYSFEYSKEAGINGSGELELEGEINTVAGGTTIPAEFGNQPATSPVELSPYYDTFYYRVATENEQSKGKPTYGKVEAYTKLPLVESEGVSELTSTSATLEAKINPVTLTTKYVIEYAPGEHGKEALEEGKGTPVPGSADSTSEPSSVSVKFAGLQPGEIYYYRVAAKNKVTEYKANANNGVPAHGKIEAFTPYGAPGLVTGEAQNITGTAATLSGTVDPKGTEAKYYFEYIGYEAYEKAEKGDAREKANPYAEGESTTPIAVPAGDVPQATAAIPVSGLLPGEMYDYALVAINKFEVRAVGPDNTFTTGAPTPPVVSTGAVSNVSQNSATLSGTVATSGLQTEYGFEIGTAPGDYGPVTGLGSIGGATTEAVSLTLGELQPGTTYYYRVTASSVDGTRQGEPVSFTTPGFPTLIAPPAAPAQFAFAKVAFPAEEKGSGTTVKTLTSKEKLAKALKVCKKDKSKSKRAKCEATARKKYPVAKAKKKKAAKKK